MASPVSTWMLDELSDEFKEKGRQAVDILLLLLMSLMLQNMADVQEQ